ncbi:hypothetical protein GVAV_001294 [Gurleya vavrai]
MQDKPREEMSYKTLYPGLSSTKKLNLVNPLFKESNEPSIKYKKRKLSRSLPQDDLNIVEYSMNEQDKDFLDRFLKNNINFKDKYGCIAYDLYDLIMDRIFKEWRMTQIILCKNYFFKKKHKQNIKKEQGEYLKCDICTFYQSNESNIVLQCYGCNICVHQECYGVPNLEKYTSIENISDKYNFLTYLWFCRKCLFFKDLSPSCLFCDIEGNAFKPVYGSKRWGHVLCAKFVKSLSFSNLVFLEPIDEIKNEDPNSKKIINGSCFLCINRKGKTIKCAYKTCKLYFHVTCGINNDHYFDMKNLISFCQDHDPSIIKKHLGLMDTDSFTSLSELDNHRRKNSNYPYLSHRPEIREKIHIKDLKESFILKIKHIKPRFTDFMANRILANDLCNFDDKLITNFVLEVGSFWNVLNNRFHDPGDFLSMKERDWKEWDKKRNVLCSKKINFDFDITIKLLSLCLLNDQKLNFNNFKDKQENSNLGLIDVKNDKLNIFLKEAEEKYKKYPEKIDNSKVKTIKKVNFRELREKREINMLFENFIKQDCKNIHVKELNLDFFINVVNSLVNLKEIVKLIKAREELIFENYKLNFLKTRLIYDKEFFIMYDIIEKLIIIPDFSIFIIPVTEQIAPFYFDIIKEPMCFNDIKGKFTDLEYNLIGFLKDIHLIINNCRTYNYENQFFINISDELERHLDQLLKYHGM